MNIYLIQNNKFKKQDSTFGLVTIPFSASLKGIELSNPTGKVCCCTNCLCNGGKLNKLN